MNENISREEIKVTVDILTITSLVTIMAIGPAGRSSLTRVFDHINYGSVNSLG